nr:MAG TPA: hypothetical protein [Bacteriophage sp.]
MFLTDFLGTPQSQELFLTPRVVPRESSGNASRNTPNVPPQGCFVGIVPVFLKKYKNLKSIKYTIQNPKIMHIRAHKDFWFLRTRR